MFFHHNARLTAHSLFLFAILLGCLAAGCHRNALQSNASSVASPPAAATPRPSPTPTPTVISATITGLNASLEDEARELPGGQIAWTTSWKLCWDAYAGARGYELETLTGEGVSRKLRRQSETRFRLEVAKGQNEKAKGLFNRELMLASIAGQVAYRVRAVLDGNRVTKWSPVMEAGRAGR